MAKKVSVPFNAKDAKTADLIKGLYDGFSITYYDFDAVIELISRGEYDAIVEARDNTNSIWAKWAIKKVGIK